MKNLFLATALFLLQTLFIHAQSSTLSILEEHEGNNYPAFMIKLPQNAEFVTSIFNETFQIDSLGVASISPLNYFSHERVIVPTISNSYLDFYYKIDAVNLDSEVIVKIMVSKGYDNYVNVENDPVIARSVIQQLDLLAVKVARKNIDLGILAKEQELQVQKEQLVLLEDEWQQLEAERLHLEARRTKKQLAIKNQQKVTLEASRLLEAEKRKATEFERQNQLKTRTNFRKVSK